MCNLWWRFATRKVVQTMHVYSWMKREKERERFARTDFAKIEDEMINITTLNYTCIRAVIILIIFPSN